MSVSCWLPLNVGSVSTTYTIDLTPETSPTTDTSFPINWVSVITISPVKPDKISPELGASSESINLLFIKLHPSIVNFVL